MKICWDNLSKLIYLPEKGFWRDGNWNYIYEKDSCSYCGDPYLIYEDKRKPNKYCSRKCSRRTEEMRKFVSSVHSGRKRPKETGIKIGKAHKGKTISNEQIEKYKKARKGKYVGAKSGTWTGGYYNKGLARFDHYVSQLKFAEKIRRSPEDKQILQAKCTYCNKFFTPTIVSVLARIRSLNGKQGGECRFYCSNDCKKECSIYNRKKFQKGFKKSTSREVQPELRQLVFERDKWICQLCESEKSLHCHHFTGIEQNPIESADVDNCITLCKICHKKVHKEHGCRNADMRCDKQKEVIYENRKNKTTERQLEGGLLSVSS